MCLAQEFKMDFLETSAKDNICVDETFMRLAIQVKKRWLDPSDDHYTSLMTKGKPTIRQRIASNHNNDSYHKGSIVEIGRPRNGSGGDPTNQPLNTYKKCC